MSYTLLVITNYYIITVYSIWQMVSLYIESIPDELLHHYYI